MRIRILGLVWLLASVFPLIASAAGRTFTGTVTSVNDPGGFLAVQVNDPASGWFRWNTSMPKIFDGATAAFYQQALSPSGVTDLGVVLSVGGVTYRPISTANITLQIHNGNATFDDRFSLSDSAVDNTGGLTYAASGLSVVLQDQDQSVFSSTAIPASLPPLADFETATFSITLTNINGSGNSASVSGTLTSIVLPPGAPALAPGGLGAAAILLGILGALALRAMAGSKNARPGDS